MLFKGRVHGMKISVFAIKNCSCVMVDGRVFMRPYLRGKIRYEEEKLDKKSEAVFARLNWTFVTFRPIMTVDDLLIITCQGYTFELIEIEQGFDF